MTTSTKPTDQERAEAYGRLRLEQPKPLVGDYVRFMDRSLRRISHVWGDDSYQYSHCGGSFHLSQTGWADFSGSLEPAVSPLHPTEERFQARFWVWKDNWAGANRGVDVFIPVRVWEYRKDDVLPDTTERRREFMIYHTEEPTPGMGYRFLVSRQAWAHTAFKTETELQHWLTSMGLVVHKTNDRTRWAGKPDPKEG